MDTHKLFLEFDKEIRLSDSKTDDLRKNRDAIRKKIRDYFTDKKWGTLRFYSQGSFPLKTNLNPISGRDYDLDDGVYFVCPLSERLGASAYHDRIKNAVADHAKEVKDKSTCVRVIYADGHHIDLPCYWLEKIGDAPKLAHKAKGFVDSDPKAFKDWVDKAISNSGSDGQLRRVIRYLKAWKDHREGKNSSIRLLSGFILTILTCEHFSKNERDDVSLKETIDAIKSRLSLSFACYAPTTLEGENLLEKYSSETIIDELENLAENAKKAIDSDCEKEASEYWRKSFGDRFPLGDDNNKGKGAKAPALGATIGTVPTVGATKPYSVRGEIAQSFYGRNTALPQSVRYLPEDFQKVKEAFPCLEYCESENCVKGVIVISAKYEQKKDGSWTIVSVPTNESQAESFRGEYAIFIDLGEKIKVFETSEKIMITAKRLNKSLLDMHISEKGECCLDYYSAAIGLGINLSQFILNKVYPFFVWQAYYDKFEKRPPCGEYSHIPGVAAREFANDTKKPKPNSFCFCGSGEKYKNCHGSKKHYHGQ
jgi:hypothetical protein